MSRPRKPLPTIFCAWCNREIDYSAKSQQARSRARQPGRRFYCNQVCAMRDRWFRRQPAALQQDALCRWLGDRWETLEELALALEKERLDLQPEKRVRPLTAAQRRKVDRMMELAERTG